MSGFAVYLHPEVFKLSADVDKRVFIGYSLNHYNAVREQLIAALPEYPSISPVKCSLEDFKVVHTEDFLKGIEQLAEGEKPDPMPQLSMECRGMEYVLPGYCYALGGMQETLRRMADDVLSRAYVFSAGGHHAYADRGHGYCLLNPMAAAVRYAQKIGFQKTLIVDWDHHHGDGTQSIFSNDPEVYCISIHSAIDLYMATQRVVKQGTTVSGKCVGHCNIPVIAREHEDKFLEAMHWEGEVYHVDDCLDAFTDALRNLPFSPDIIFIFSGYDGHRSDCGKDIQDWTYDTFEELTHNVLDVASEHRCPILSVHGGGYKISVTVSAAVRHVTVLAQV